MCKAIRARLRLSVALGALIVGAAVIAGCGGSGKGSSWSVGGGGSGPGGPSGGGQQANSTATTFHVDVTTGKVTIVPPSGQAQTGALRSNVAFNGSSVTFNSSQLLDSPGDTGVKVLSVSLTNNWGLPIGQTPSGTPTGLRVLFSNFVNESSLPNIQSLCTVSTFAGTGAASSTDGPTSSATLNGPYGVASDGAGNLYVAELNGNRVRKIGRNFVETIVGNGTAGDVDGTGSAAQLNGPVGIAYDKTNQALFIGEYGGNRVRRINLSNGTISTIAGTGAVGYGDGAGNAATFNQPVGIAVDSSGNVYVSEQANERIRKIAFTGTDRTQNSSYTVSTIAGSGTQASVDGVGTAASFNTPLGPSIGPDGALYVCDYNGYVIRRVATNGAVSTIAGTGLSGSSDGIGSSATFGGPSGCWWVNGALYVSDQGNHTIRQLTLVPNSPAANPASWRVQTLAGTAPTSGSTDGAGNVALFSNTDNITADNSGSLYVADLGNNKIRKIVPTNGLFPVGIPTGGTSSDNVQLSNPSGTIPNQANGSNLPYITYAGSLAPGATSTAQNWNFIIPNGITAFQFTVSVEADTTALNPPGATSGAGSTNVTVRTLAGGSSGFKDGAGATALFGAPQHAAADASGNVYVSDGAPNYAIRRISAAGVVTTIAGVVGTGAGTGPVDGQGNVAVLAGPTGITVSQDGTAVYFGDGNTVRCASIAAGADATQAANWYVATIAGTNGTAGKTDGSGTSALFNGVSGCALDSSGNLYVAESAGNRVRQLQFRSGDPTQAANWQVSTLAGDNSLAAGASGTTDATGTAARFNAPMGLGTDPAGNVYVADSGNNKIRVITPAGVVTTFAGVAGVAGTAGHVDSSTSTSAQFNAPKGIAVDSSGYVYVSDTGTGANWIRRITPASSGVSPSGSVETVAGTGASGTTNGAGNVAQFASPLGLAVSPSGNLYAVDTASDYAVRVIQRVVSAGTN